MSFNITSDTTVTWTWMTNYWFTSQTNGSGTVQPAPGWYGAGSEVTSTATAGQYWHLDSWGGDVAAEQAESNPVVVNMTGPRLALATFAPNLTSNGVPELWYGSHGWTNDFDNLDLSDSDSDGSFNWQEYILDTNPTNEASVFAMSVGNSNGLFRVDCRQTSTGRTYHVYWMPVLGISGWTEIDTFQGNGGTRSWELEPTEPRGFFRVGVRAP